MIDQLLLTVKWRAVPVEPKKLTIVLFASAPVNITLSSAVFFGAEVVPSPNWLPLLTPKFNKYWNNI